VKEQKIPKLCFGRNSAAYGPIHFKYRPQCSILLGISLCISSGNCTQV